MFDILKLIYTNQISLARYNIIVKRLNEHVRRHTIRTLKQIICV